MPARRTREREELLEALEQAGRESSAATVMFHTTVAAQRGLSVSEEKAVDVLLREGPLTHAELGQATGLAPASVTNLIDRLAQRGYVAREPHPEDRRRVLVRADGDRVFAEIAPLFEGWVGSLRELYDSFSDDELRTIARFMTEAAARQREATRALTED